MKVNKLLLIYFIFNISFALKAQDIHFSQIGANPLEVNPANAGMFYENMRFGITTRNQWFNIGQPVKIMSAFLDGRKYFEIPWQRRRNVIIPLDLTVGLSVVKYQAGNGNLNSTSVYPVVGLKYDINGLFTPKCVWSVSGATGLDFIDKNIEFNQLTFNNQWDPGNYVFDPTKPNFEPYHANSYHVLAIPFGVNTLLYVPEESFALSAGISEIFQNRVGDSFYDENTTINPICKFHAEIGIVLKKVPLHIYYLATNQYFEDMQWYEVFDKTITKERIMGFNVCVELRNYNLIWGLGSRNSKFANYRGDNFRDLLFNLGFSAGQLTILGNYDFNVSRFHYGTNYQGAMELTVKYTITTSRNIYKTTSPVYNEDKKPFSFPTASFD
ncbi:MAG: type IX secretion system membrane protein PorP/SprF [Bacteroidia bacterium]|nr:type IX secretion system membrane protein PorP/SprF [Bacteroidia bacterium]